MTIVEGFAREDLALIQDANTAALLWREKWLSEAWSPKRRGRQIPPPGNWTQLIFRCGRGYGKSRALTEWLSWEMWRLPGLIGHAVGPTLSDVRGTLMLGPAGFRSVIPAECLLGGSWDTAYDSTHNEITLSNQSLIRGFGAADAGGRLRGPQANCGVGDECREWDKPAGNLEFVHSNMMFGLRLPYPDGTPTRAVLATTPKPIAYLKKLYRSPGVVVVTGNSYENMDNLSEAYRNHLLTLEGTQIGKVEIHGEDVESEQNVIFKRSWFRLWPAEKKLPEFQFVLMSMDTAMSEENYDLKRQTVDFSACVVLGVFNTKQCFTEAELKKFNVKTKYAAVVCDAWMERLGFPELLEEARKTYRTKWGKPGHTPHVVLIENKQSGISLRQVLIQYGVPTWPSDPRGQSKTMRCHAASPLLLQGMLFVPESVLPERKGIVRDWAEPILEQMCAFAGEGSIEHDDMLDAVVQAMLYLSESGHFHAEPQGRAYPDPDEKEEKDQREAQRAADREKRGRHSAYGE